MGTVKFSIINLFVLFLGTSLLAQQSTSAIKISFSDLANEFPTVSDVSREILFSEVLKGGWPELLPDTKNYANTCAIRMSVALNNTKLKIGSEFSDGNHKDGNGNYIAVKVPTMKSFLNEAFGESDWGMSISSGDTFDIAKNLPNKKGIVLYTFPSSCSFAFGHVDLWDGKKCLSDCPPEDTNCAVTIEFWELN